MGMQVVLDVTQRGPPIRIAWPQARYRPDDER